MTSTLRVLLGGVNLLDEGGQYARAQNAEFALTPFSVSYRALPLGLLSIAAAQRAFGATRCEYELYDFDAPAERFTMERIFAEWAARLADYRPHVVALGCLTQRQSPKLERAIGVARAYVREMAPATKLIVGGAAATAEPGRFLRAGADAVGLGEGERTFTEAIDCIAAGDSLEKVAGLALPRPGAPPESDVVLTAPRALVDDLDTLPMPAWDLADVASYIRRNRGVFSPMQTQRGCPYACVYCAHERRFRAHRPARVVDELQILHERYGARRIDLVDEIFNCRRDRVLAIRDEKKRRGLKVELQDFDGVRADILDDATLDAMKEMGFVALSVALESASSRVQQLINKRLVVDRAVRALGGAVARGMFVNAFFMIGFPTETREEVRETLALARSCSSHQSTVSKVEAYPGTPMWNLVVAQKGGAPAHRPELFERYGEREDPGFSSFPERELHAMWRRGVFDIYNDPARMKRLADVVTTAFLRGMYRKFYEEHGLWSARFGTAFELALAARDYAAIAREAERQYCARSQ